MKINTRVDGNSSYSFLTRLSITYMNDNRLGTFVKTMNMENQFRYFLLVKDYTFWVFILSCKSEITFQKFHLNLCTFLKMSEGACSEI